MDKIIKRLLFVLSITVFLLIIMAIFRICPPEGPWIMPPWCESNSIKNNNQATNSFLKTNFSDLPKKPEEKINETPGPKEQPSIDIISRPNFQKGVTFGAMSWKEEDKQLIDDNIDILKKFNVEWVILIPDWFIFPSYNGTEIKPYYDSKTFPNPTGWITPTLTDDELTTIIKKLRAKNINVILKPHIDPIDFGINPLSNRGSLNPTDWNLFFDNYKKYIIHYAIFAEENNIPIFVIGTELDTVVREMPNSKKRWEELIKEIRSVYSGKLTYSVACFDDCYSPSQVEFWDSLDYIGFEPYFGLTNKDNPSVDEMKKSFDEKFNLYAKPLYKKYNKPILLTEANIYSKDGANKNPLGTSSNKPDYQEQADYYTAMFKSISDKEWIQGIYWWGWYLSTTSKRWNKTDDLSDSFVRKPAGQIMKLWYKKIET